MTQGQTYEFYWSRCGTEFVDVDHGRSTALLEYEKKLRRTRAGFWTAVTRLRSWRPRGEIYVKRAIRWPDILTRSEPSAFVVSERLAGMLKGIPASQLEVFPVRVRVPPKAPPPPSYFLINFCCVVDALNLSSTKLVVSQENPDLEHLFRSNSFRNYVIDPTRLKAGVQAFVTKYVGAVCVIGAVAARLKSKRFIDLRLDPLPHRRERAASRKAELNIWRRDARKARAAQTSAKPKAKGISGLQRALRVVLPSRIKAFWKNREPLLYNWGEVYDTATAITTTQELRDWKDLDWPRDLIVISDDGRGGYLALDLCTSTGKDCAVMYFDHELASTDDATGRITPELEVAARSFDAWIQRLAKGKSGIPRFR